MRSKDEHPYTGIPPGIENKLGAIWLQAILRDKDSVILSKEGESINHE